MVTHELTVFPDGRVDGCFSVRKGDYNSHALHFALTEGLTAAAAKLLLWMADGSTPIEYDTRTNRGTCTGSDVQITPESWGPVGRARLQLVLLDETGNEIWQCRQFAVPVEDGDPQETTPGPIDLSEATAQPGDVRQGMIYFGQDGKKTGTKAESQIAVFTDHTGTDAVASVLDDLEIENWSLTRVCKAQDGCLAAGLVILPFAYPAATEDYTDTKTKREDGVDYILLEMLTTRTHTMWIDGVACSSNMVDGQRSSSATVKAAEAHMMVMRKGIKETSPIAASFLILPYLSGEQSAETQTAAENAAKRVIRTQAAGAGGYRLIPETITATLAFAKGERGWWNDELYESLLDANVYTPSVNPDGWKKIEP